MSDSPSNGSGKIVRARAGKFALLIGGGIAGLLLAELAVRALDLPPRPLEPLPIPSYRLSQDPSIAYEYRPGYSPTEEPFDSFHRGYAINSAGFRDHEYPKSKPKGTFRTIVLGDSTTAGNGVSDIDRTYTKRLEKLLNSQSSNDWRYEVLNMGVGGYHTMQEVATLRAKGISYDPDLVLLLFCLNDFSPTSDGGVYEALQAKNRHMRQMPQPTFMQFLCSKSRLAFLLRYHLGSSQNDYEDWYTEQVLKGKTTVAAGLELFASLQRQHGFTAYMLILPSFQVPFDKYQYTSLHEAVFRCARDYPGITVVDLLPDFRKVDSNATVFSYDGCHMNEHGHSVLANLLLPSVRSTAQRRSRESAKPEAFDGGGSVGAAFSQ